MKQTTEGKATINIDVDDKISKKLSVFYNPVMKHNRDISIIILNCIPDQELQIADPLAGSGVRAIRLLMELDPGKIKNISVNDYDENFIKTMQDNLKLNNIEDNGTINVENKDANIFLLESSGFDYIDIDPFGTPNPFLDAAVRRVARNSILAVTATDTSALCGAYPKACKRKYWAEPLNNHLMHEFGLRILIRKCQLVAAQYEKALMPIFSYSKDHYMRVFLRVQKTKTESDEVLRQHRSMFDAGPIWAGQLWDADLAQKMHEYAIKNKEKYGFDDKLLSFLNTIRQESKISKPFFHDIHELNKQKKLPLIKSDVAIETLQKKGINASRTIFNQYGIKTEIDEKEFIRLLDAK